MADSGSLTPGIPSSTHLWAAVFAQLQFRRKFQRVDDLGELSSSLNSFDVPCAQRIGQIPPDSHENDLCWKLGPFEA